MNGRRSDHSFHPSGGGRGEELPPGSTAARCVPFGCQSRDAGLEERLGVRLLARATRSVAPTEAGEQLLARLQPALTEVREAVGQITGLRVARTRVRHSYTRPALRVVSRVIGTRGELHAQKRTLAATIFILGLTLPLAPFQILAAVMALLAMSNIAILLASRTNLDLSEPAA